MKTLILILLALSSNIALGVHASQAETDKVKKLCLEFFNPTTCDCVMKAMWDYDETHPYKETKESRDEFVRSTFKRCATQQSVTEQLKMKEE